MSPNFRRRVLWLIGGRAAVVTLLLGSAILIQIQAPGSLPIDPFFFLIGLTYALTVVYILLLRHTEEHRWIVDVQLGCDAVIVSALVYLTGGVSSYFTSLYTLPIIAASTIQSQRTGMMVGVLGSVVYAGLAAGQYLGTPALPVVVGADARPQERVALFIVGLNIFGFVAVAALSGWLAERLRSTGAALEQTSNQLADLRAFSEHVISSLTGGLATTDIEGRILSFNKAAEGITGMKASEALLQDATRVLQLPPQFTELFKSREARPRLPRVEYAFRIGEGREIELGISVASLRTPRGEVGFVFTFQDVTDARRKEREARVQQRLAAVGEMAAGIAHEIRNPLASMSGSLQILRQELPLSDEQSQLMDIVLRESDRLNDTIRSFLAYARPQRNASTRFDVRQIVTDAATLLQNSPERLETHAVRCDVPAAAGVVPGGRSADPAGRLEPCDQWPAGDGGWRHADACRARRRARAGQAGHDHPRGDRRGHRHRAGGARRHPAAVSRRVRARHGPRPVHRSPHRQRLWRRAGDDVGKRQGHDRDRQTAGRFSPGCDTRADIDTRSVGLQSDRTELILMATDTETEPATTAPPRVLVVDDERSMRELLTIVLKRDGYEVLVADDGRRAIELLKKQRVDILITDIRMPQMSGVDVLREAKNIDPEIISIVMTAFASTDTAVEALRLGAADYVHKSPSAANELRLRVRKELERKQLQRENVLLKRVLGSAHKFSNIIGRSDAMVSVFQLIETIAPTSSTVLITGESGTGKELAARAIHFNSLRKERPFVALNCGALSETLLDSELFGHMKGAFTGADTNKKGLIEVAEKGSIFLDEIGEMSPLVQVKLLRVLQERKYRRLGGTEEVEADIRVIAATNRDLSKMVAEGTFREDLFYRINVIPIRLPALRERVEDIPLLAEHFVPRFATEMGKTITGISGAALACLQAYGWPGNIRELENAIERAVALERTPTILVESLPEQVRGAAPTVAGTAAPADNFPVNGFDLEQHVQHIEREYIAEALKRAGGVKVKAAELLGMSFRSFRYYMKKYDLK